MSEIRPVSPASKHDGESSVTAWDDPRRPIIMVDRPGPRRDALDIFIRLLAGLALAMVVLLLGALLLMVISLAGTVSSAGNGIGQAGERLMGEAQQAAERVADLTDPTHPPRGLAGQDPEFDQLRVISTGESPGSLTDYTLILQEVRRHDGASSPDEAQYAVLHRKLKTPEQIKLGPVVVREDWGEQDYYLYKGEIFSLGQQFYKVNWVSKAQQEIAVARFRTPDNLTASPKFQLK